MHQFYRKKYRYGALQQKTAEKLDNFTVFNKFPHDFGGILHFLTNFQY